MADEHPSGRRGPTSRCLAPGPRPTQVWVWYQALLVLVWYRKREEMTVLGARFGVSRATRYRYRDEVIAVLHAQAPQLHEAVVEVAEQGWSHVILDGKLFRTDRVAAAITSVEVKAIHSWYSGKHHAFDANTRCTARPAPSANAAPPC
ncbi:MAG TPA: transposase family protein [Pseudonocardia sp.]